MIEDSKNRVSQCENVNENTNSNLLISHQTFYSQLKLSMVKISKPPKNEIFPMSLCAGM
jgi:hypothetical protein